MYIFGVSTGVAWQTEHSEQTRVLDLKWSGKVHIFCTEMGYGPHPPKNLRDAPESLASPLSLLRMCSKWTTILGWVFLRKKLTEFLKTSKWSGFVTNLDIYFIELRRNRDTALLSFGIYWGHPKWKGQRRRQIGRWDKIVWVLSLLF